MLTLSIYPHFHQRCRLSTMTLNCERGKTADLGVVSELVFGFFELPVCPSQSGGQSPGSSLWRCSLPESSGTFPVRSRQAGVEGATSFPLLAEVTDKRPSNMSPERRRVVVYGGALTFFVVGSSDCDPTRRY